MPHFIAIFLLISNVVLATTLPRKVYYAHETIWPAVSAPGTGFGSDIVVYNPSSVDQKITFDLHVSYLIGSSKREDDCVSTSTGIIVKPGENIHLVCVITSTADVTDNSPIQVYGSITATDQPRATQTGVGFVVAGGSQWSMSIPAQRYSSSFVINGSKPF